MKGGGRERGEEREETRGKEKEKRKRRRGKEKEGKKREREGIKGKDDIRKKNGQNSIKKEKEPNAHL